MIKLHFQKFVQKIRILYKMNYKLSVVMQNEVTLKPKLYSWIKMALKG